VQYSVSEIVYIRKLAETTTMLPHDIYRVAALQTHEGRQYATTIHASNLKGNQLPQDDESVPVSIDED